jgi:hypothetical protein
MKTSSVDIDMFSGLPNRIRTTAFVAFVLLLAGPVQSQVNSGSDGRHGQLNPTADLVINMADQPDGIYQYTSVNIRAGVRVSFVRNSGGTPVVWLVQNRCVINGVIDVSGLSPGDNLGGGAGPGGFGGGNGGIAATAGQGPGGGAFGDGSSASYGTAGTPWAGHSQVGALYGNQFVLPLLGGSGGGGSTNGTAGGGGGGAILIAASQDIELNGDIFAVGGWGGNAGIELSAPCPPVLLNFGGAGSGGGVRLVATRILGGGTIDVSGGLAGAVCPNGALQAPGRGGSGRVRFDALNIGFSGNVLGAFTHGFQPVIIPPPTQAVSLAIQTVGGVTVAANPTGVLTSPDVVIPGSRQNPVPIMVRCANIPLNSEITVEVKPANGPTISAVGLNNGGTAAGSTATLSVSMPRGGGTIQAKATSGIAGLLGAGVNRNQKARSYADTGLTADGERFAKVEITALLGQSAQVVYLAESGKAYSFPTR